MTSTNTTLGVGLHYDVPAPIYHADPCAEPSLSSSVLRTVLSRSLRHAWLEHPRLGRSDAASAAPSREMRFGSVVHAIQSGDESEIVVAEFENYKTAAARAWRDDVLASGRTPMLTHEMAGVRPTVSALIEKAASGIDNSPFVPHARSEVTAIWREASGIFCRARFDRLVIDPSGHTADIWDWKTTSDVSPEAIERHIINQGYHIQAAFYERGLRLAASFTGPISFIFAFVEKEAPHAVRRVCLSEAFMSIGRMEVSRAIDAWAGAVQSGRWPERGEGETLHVTPPLWFLKRMEDAA